jgi:hypothetical protein
MGIYEKRQNTRDFSHGRFNRGILKKTSIEYGYGNGKQIAGKSGV